MTREEQLAFCRKCTNRKFDPQQGIICRLTDQKADFQDECPDFNLDEHVKESKHEPQRQLEGMEMIKQLSDDSVAGLREYQDFSSALIGGLLLMLFGAVIWAAVSVVTGYQIGYMAIGIGFLVGFGVRYFGAGVDPKFGFLAGALSVLSCLIGNVFSQIAFTADAQGLTYFQTLGLIDFSVLIEVIVETFSPMDIVFYAIAIGAAYKYAFRSISPEELQQMHEQNIDPVPPGYNIRKPVVIIASVILVGFLFLANQGASGIVTFTYEDGSRLSEGSMVNGKEDGEWTYWYPNGKVQASTNYIKGTPHGQWIIYYESGAKMSEGGYEYGNQNGPWMTYYPEGTLQDSGLYVMGREQGKWNYYLLNGQVRETGGYMRGRKQGEWRSFHENGQMAGLTQFLDDEVISNSTWDENGSPLSQMKMRNNRMMVMNAWNSKGEQTLTDGNGIYEEYYTTGEIMGRTAFKNGLKSGKYHGFHLDGSKEQEGEFINEVYHFQTVWKPDGTAVFENGNGRYERFYNMGLVTEEEGDVVNGLREGEWYYYDPRGILLSTVTWTNGKQTGPYQFNYPDGSVWTEGSQVDGKPDGDFTWYYEDGTMQTTFRSVNGLKEGTQTFYGSYGEVVREEIYEKGELIDVKIGQ